MPINKVMPSFDEAVRDVFDGAVLLIGDFGSPAEAPAYLIAAVARKGVQNLTIACNRAGFGVQMLESGLIQERLRPMLPVPPDWYDQGLLVERDQVKKAIVTAVATALSVETALPVEEKINAGELELELIPQGTLAERVRAAKAGIPAFYTPTGVGTIVAQGKEVREFNGREYLLEHALKGDFSLVRAHKADRYGNLVYKGTARDFNAAMAGASAMTIAEVDEVVEVGALDPECIVTPAAYVDRIVVRPQEPRPWYEST